LDPCVYDVFDSESPKEVTPEVVTLTPGTPVLQHSTVTAGSVMLEDSYLRQSKIRKLAVAITANQYIFQFQVPENQRNIPYVSYYNTFEYYDTLQTHGRLFISLL
jgi:hypothetical protein